MKKKCGVLMALLVLTSSVNIAAEGNSHNDQSIGDAKAGKEKSALCATCHGADGNSSMGDWPKLAGQHHDYIVSSLKSYQSGERKNDVMAGMVASLSDDDMHNLAAYFSSQSRLGGQAKTESLELGKKIYRAGNQETGAAACMACHGPNGAGNPAAGYPSLSGQHAKYVENSLNQYRNGNRSHLVMSDVSKKLSEEEIKAVSNYIQGLY